MYKIKRSLSHDGYCSLYAFNKGLIVVARLESFHAIVSKSHRYIKGLLELGFSPMEVYVMTKNIFEVSFDIDPTHVKRLVDEEAQRYAFLLLSMMLTNKHSGIKVYLLHRFCPHT